MIRGLIFSKDRALQLDATLASFFRLVADALATELVVLYRASSARHASQYDVLMRQYADRVRFIRETSFRRQVLQILKQPSRPARSGERDFLKSGFGRQKVGSSANPQDEILFLVDDCIFVRPFRLETASQSLNANPDAVGFSLRLGTNTTDCYAFNRPQSLPEFAALAGGFLKFRWAGADGDFAYPFEISSSLYPFGLAGDLISRLEFKNPNALESKMAAEARRFTRTTPALLCYPQSVAFSTPLNRVQEVFANRTGEAEQYSTERLADVFDQGRRIITGALEGFVPSACHQEVVLSIE